MQRETAHRVFAQEFNASRLTIEGEGEKDPSFLVTPTGAKVNRLHVVGVCTDVEAVGESGEVWRARISDPTGVFTVYAGQYQPEAAQALSQVQPPAFVAVTGKARTYEPEPGSVFVSVRPEAVTVVDEATRDQWLLDTARRTKQRLEATAEAEGVRLAHGHYGPEAAAPYWGAVRTALEGLLPGGSVQVHAAPEAPAWTPETKETDAEDDAFDEEVLAIVKRLEGDEGARWDDILAEAGSGDTTAEAVEESLNRLMDKGLVYEPTLGVLRTT